MKASLLRRASVFAVPAVTCAWTHFAMAQAPAAPAAPAAAPAAPAAGAPAAPAAPAPPATPPPPPATISGYVDAAYHVNLSKMSYDAPVPLRSYDLFGGNSFIFHDAHVGIAHNFTPDSSVFISLDFGSDAAVDNFNYAPVSVVLTPGAPGMPPTVGKGPPGTPVDIREGYGKWNPGDLTFIAGKFVTLEGIEVVDGPTDPTITRGFLFGLAEPVAHTGARGMYTFAGGMGHVAVGILNGWDTIVYNN